MRVLRINASDTYPLRHQILRPGRPIETCHFTGDDEDQTFHLGAFVESKLVSVASFFFEKNRNLDAPYQYRLRGMATLPEYRCQGLSSELLKMGFPIVKQNFCQLVWCNARLEAKGFYEKVGFVATGEIFDVPNIGQHILMYKNLE